MKRRARRFFKPPVLGSIKERLPSASTRLLLFLACFGLWPGCSSTGPVYDSSAVGADAAIIRGDGQFSFGATYGLGDAASISVAEIDGLPTTRPAESKRIRPGKHRLGVEARNARSFAVGYIDLQAKARHEYTVKARQHGIGFIVTLFDTTDEEREVELKRIKLLKSGESQRATAPIFIPVKSN